MNVTEHTHRSGKTKISPTLLKKTRLSIESTEFRVKCNCAKKLRTILLSELAACGWSDQVQISRRRKLTITAMHGRTALCLQTGNMARFYADLLKLQALYAEKSIDSAIYLVPTRSCARIMGQNIAHFERLTAELDEEFFKVITLPIVVYGFESQEVS